MDLKYLHFRQQVELIRWRSAKCAPSRTAHVGLAAAYGKRIAAYNERHRPPEAV